MKKLHKASHRTGRAPLAPMPKPEPEDVQLKKARKLPMFGPGIVITVPLSLLPEYMQLYQLRPMTAREIQDRIDRKLGHRSNPAEMVLVKREVNHE